MTLREKIHKILDDCTNGNEITRDPTNDFLSLFQEMGEEVINSIQLKEKHSDIEGVWSDFDKNKIVDCSHSEAMCYNQALKDVRSHLKEMVK